MKIPLLFFLILSFTAYAHEDRVLSVSKGNIHMECQYGWDEFEITNKINILLDLSAKLAKEKGYTTNLYVYYGHDYVQRDSAFYILGYGAFTYWDFDRKPWKKVKATGLTLLIRDRDIDIKQLLNLIRSAFENISVIQKNQSLFSSDKPYSVSGDSIKKYLNASDAVVERIIQEKTFRHAKPSEINGDIDYYYQNNEFHFYNSKQWGTTDVGDKLVVDHILEIVGSHKDGHFIFINDSAFYYLPMYKDKATGPFTIDSIQAGRLPILKYDHTHIPVNRFTLFIETYDGSRKAAFFPDSNLVISNFDKLENDFILDMLNKPTTQQTDSDSNMQLYVILIALGLSIGLNVWLWLKRSE